jgi:hypothetical protein
LLGSQNINPGALLPAFNGPLVSWKRSTVFLNYTLAKVDNNTDGPFRIPATENLDDEWGPATGGGGGQVFILNGIGVFGTPPAPTDIRSRLNVNFNNQVIRNVLVSLGVNTSTAPPYTLLTESDDNNDVVFNDRPDSVGRNTLRASAQTNVFLFAAYQFAFGTIAPLPPGRRVRRRRAGAHFRSEQQAVPHAAVRAGAESDEPAQLHRIQRDIDLAVFRPAHQCPPECERSMWAYRCSSRGRPRRCGTSPDGGSP